MTRLETLVAKTSDFLRSRRRLELPAEQLQALEDVMSDPVTMSARKVLSRKGDLVTKSTLLVEGYMCRYMDDRNGHRQLVAVHVPGDFVDLHGYPLQRLDHDVAMLTDCTIAQVDHDVLTTLIERYPLLGRMLWFSTLLDAAMHREWIFQLGRLDAAGRIAHLLCETHARLVAVGRADGDSFDFPLTQQDMAEACGLTSIHVNRVLARLRREGKLEIRERRVHLLDRRALVTMGEFDREYLYIDDGLLTP